MIALIIIGSVIGVLLLVILGILFWIYKKFFYTPQKDQNDIHKVEGIGKLLDPVKFHEQIELMLSQPYEDLWVKSYDGLKLHGYFYENKNSDQYVLLFNGFRSLARRDYCQRAMDLIQDGRNVILCEQRGHGLSEGHFISLGRREQHDVIEWVKFAREKFGDKARITVAGSSLGGTTVLLASDKLPGDIKVFADSVYPGEKQIIQQIMRRRKYNPTFCWPFFYFSALLFGHVRLKDNCAINVAKSKCKIMIVHCDQDTIVPMEMNKELFEANHEHVQLAIFKNLQHALAYFKEHEKYKEIFYKFLDE